MKQNHSTTVRGDLLSPEALSARCGITLRAAQIRLQNWKQSDKSNYQYSKLIRGTK